ncbi:MAG TPA: ATP-binding protein [Granulicella sp.]|jgi:two-component system sensor kinase FixL|nr:ATP-binding protein [Granulicella sp.]
MRWFLFGRSQTALFLRVGCIVGLISLADWKISAEVPLGFLYLLPMLLASRGLQRYQILILAALCTLLSEWFDGYPWTLTSGLPRDLLYFAAFAGIGSFVYEANRSRQAAAAHLQLLEAEMSVRRGLEEQLEHLIETSPVAILSADGDGRILLANDAAHRLFATSAEAFTATPISLWLPSFATVPHLRESNRGFRTLMQCKGHRADGSIFIADVWFSTYQTTLGPRISAMIVDSSEDFRDREEDALQQLLSGSRIVVTAISHEIRNVCGAIAMVHQNLVRSGGMSHNPDFEALGTLILALEKIASLELRVPRETPESAASVDLRSFMEELRIVVEPALAEADTQVLWEFPSALPTVWADRHSLMQVFLNLVRNSARALAQKTQPKLTFRVTETADCVSVAVIDNGEGVAHPELLFRPFQPHSEASGLGLCISRALMRSFRGELDYQPSTEGATFVVKLSRSSN